MPGRLGPRFALEAVFLIALAVAMGLADLTATAIVVVMAIAWLLVAIVEWLASRDATGGSQSWGPQPGAGWHEQVDEPATELLRLPQPVPQPVPEPEVDEDTGAPLAAAAAAGERQRWFRRRGGSDGGGNGGSEDRRA